MVRDKNDIPEGWFLCDGSERTDKYGTSKAVPDLRDKFIRGVGGSYAIGDGDGSHSLSTDINDAEQDGNHTHDTGQHEHDVTGDAHNHSAYTNNNNYASTTTGSASHGVSDVSVYDGSGSTQLKTSQSHSHSISSSHNHDIASVSYDAGDHHDQSNTTDGSHSHTGGKHIHDWDNQPQYYVLAFIIKMY